MGRNNAKPKASKATKNNDDSAIEILPYLFLGPRSATSQTYIQSHGITHVLSIGSSPPVTLPNVKYIRISLADSQTASLSKAYEHAAAAITNARDAGGKILVHCVAAISRSPTIVTAYLMTESGMTLKDALGLIILARPAVKPNPGLFEQLKGLELSLKGTCSLDIDSLPLQKEQRVALFTSPPAI